MKTTFRIEGMDKLKKDLERLGKVPQKHVTASAKKGMNIVLKDAKANAPEDEGNLKRAMNLRGEKSRYKAKKVYALYWDDITAQYNDIFQKVVKNPVHCQSHQAYYPASIEYGYFLRNGKYMPGTMFVHYALTNNAPRVAGVMISTMKKKIDQEIAKAGLK